MGSFNPTKWGLVTYYLKKKIIGRPLPVDDILTVDDAYFKSPDQLRPRAMQGSDNEWYFYTIRPNCKLVTDDGFYFVFTVEDVLNNENLHVGFMRILTYYQGLPPQGKKTNWIIQEFSAVPEIIPAIQPGAKTLAESFVVCKLILTSGNTKEYSEGKVGLLDSLLEKAKADQEEKETQSAKADEKEEENLNINVEVLLYNET